MHSLSLSETIAIRPQTRNSALADRAIKPMFNGKEDSSERDKCSVVPASHLRFLGVQIHHDALTSSEYAQALTFWSRMIHLQVLQIDTRALRSEANLE